jgi:hypothetical protein
MSLKLTMGCGRYDRAKASIDRNGEKERAVAGPDIYLWGFTKTRAEVDKLLEYSFQQGLTPRRFEPEELFTRARSERNRFDFIPEAGERRA